MLAIAIPILPESRKPDVQAPHVLWSRALKRTYMMTLQGKNQMSNSKGHERRLGVVPFAFRYCNLPPVL
jgi:hypothetical protein